MKVTMTVVAEFPDNYESDVGFIDSDTEEAISMQEGFDGMPYQDSNPREYINDVLEFLDYLDDIAEQNASGGAYFNWAANVEVEGGDMS